MRPTPRFPVTLLSLLLVLAAACSKEPTGNVSPPSPTGPTGPPNNPRPRTLYLGVSPGNIEFGLPATSVTLRGEAFYSDTTALPVLSSVNWRKIQGPEVFSIQSPTNLSTAINGLGTGTYVFGCSVRDIAGRSDSAATVISVHEPAMPERDTVLLNQSWIDSGFGMFFRINLGTIIPPGRALRKVFLKTDCDTAFMQLTNQPNDAYTYSLEYLNDSVWLHVGFYTVPGNNMCTHSPDMPDIRLVY